MSEGETKRYERLIRNTETGELTPESEYDEMEKADAPKEDQPNLSRRNFLKAGAVATGTAAVGGGALLMKKGFEGTKGEVNNADAESENTVSYAEQETEREEESRAERNPAGKGVFEQIEEFGEVVDLGAAVETIKQEEFEKLVGTEEGRRGLGEIAARYRKYDIEALKEEFRNRGLPDWLAVALPAHESDWKKGRKSSRGARGPYQFMPKTIKALGYEVKDAHNVPKANKMAAEYLEKEKERFGDDVYMILSAYVAGAGLNGFTKIEEDRNKWDIENLNHYSASILNEEYKKMLDKGFVFEEGIAYEDYSIQGGDTMWDISRVHGVDMDYLAEVNDIKNPSKIRAGDTIKIPYSSSLERELRKRCPHTFHMIEYAPKLIAMQDALAKMGHTMAREDSGREEGVKVAMNE